MYIYELGDWPKFSWDQNNLVNLLISLRHKQGRLMGGMESIGFHLSEETVLQALFTDSSMVGVVFCNFHPLAGTSSIT